MEESLQRDPDGYCTLLVYGQFLKQKNSERGQEMIRKAYDIMLEAFNSDSLPQADYSRLINAARLIGDQATVKNVEQAQRDQSQQNADYSHENLLEKVDALPDHSTKKVKSGGKS